MHMLLIKNIQIIVKNNSLRLVQLKAKSISSTGKKLGYISGHVTFLSFIYFFVLF